MASFFYTETCVSLFNKQIPSYLIEMGFLMLLIWACSVLCVSRIKKTYFTLLRLKKDPFSHIIELFVKDQDFWEKLSLSTMPLINQRLEFLKSRLFDEEMIKKLRHIFEERQNQVPNGDTIAPPRIRDEEETFTEEFDEMDMYHYILSEAFVFMAVRNCPFRYKTIRKLPTISTLIQRRWSAVTEKQIFHIMCIYAALEFKAGDFKMKKGKPPLLRTVMCAYCLAVMENRKKYWMMYGRSESELFKESFEDKIKDCCKHLEDLLVEYREQTFKISKVLLKYGPLKEDTVDEIFRHSVISKTDGCVDLEEKSVSDVKQCVKKPAFSSYYVKISILVLIFTFLNIFFKDNTYFQVSFQCFEKFQRFYEEDCRWFGFLSVLDFFPCIFYGYMADWRSLGIKRMGNFIVFRAKEVSFFSFKNLVRLSRNGISHFVNAMKYIFRGRRSDL
nr:uncharacterized protein LOC107441926 [Parasteatoda tepidariorum]